MWKIENKLKNDVKQEKSAGKMTTKTKQQTVQFNWGTNPVMGVTVTTGKPISSVLFFTQFSESSEYWLHIEYHILMG